MKRVPISFLAFAMVAAVAILVPTVKRPFTVLPIVQAASGCTNASFSGHYGFTFSGFQLQSGKSVPFYGAGLGIADGAGNFAATFAFSQNGALPGDRYIVSTNNPYTATFTVNSDCSISITATPGSGGDNAVGVIIGGGSEVLATAVSAPDTLNLDLKKQ